MKSQVDAKLLDTLYFTLLTQVIYSHISYMAWAESEKIV